MSEDVPLVAPSDIEATAGFDQSPSAVAQNLLNLNPTEVLVTEASKPAHLKFAAALDGLQQAIPELKDKSETLKTVGNQLIDDFAIEDAFFDDVGRSTIFTAVADRYSKLDEKDEAYAPEKAFIFNVLSMAAREYSPKLLDAKKAIEAEKSPLSPAGEEAVYDRYTDHELSAELTRKIKQGDMLSATKTLLGITPENEDPFEIRVLSIVADDAQANGLNVPMANLKPSGDWQTDKKTAKAESDFIEAQLDYKRGLVGRAKKMTSELGLEDTFAPAWVTTVNGKRFLCLSMPMAEKINDPSLTDANEGYTVENIDRDFANLVHEYVHTQGHLNVDGEFNFGVNLEELRAEEFSGNRQGYLEVKGFFLDYATITGQDLREVMHTLPKGGKPEEIMATIANRVGIDRMLEVLLAAPINYLNSQSNPFLRAADEYLGGYDGIIGRLIEDEVTRGGEETMEARITERAHKMSKIIKANNNYSLWDHRRLMGLNTMTNLVNKRAEELGLKEPKSGQNIEN